MKPIGVSFIIERQGSFVLQDLLYGVPIENFYWSIGMCELFSNALNETRFDESYYNGNDFHKMVYQEAPGYFITLADFKAFPSKKSIINITTLEEYLNSECKIALFIVDSKYIAIYAKNIKILQQIEKNAQNKGFAEIEYFTKETDPRTGMAL
jgi:Protein of unknown function (DUF2691).